MRIFSFILFLTMITTIVSCSLSKNIKNGTMAYEAKQYAVAVGMLENEFDKADNKRVKAEKAYLLGRSYFYLEENDLAIEWLDKSRSLAYGNEAVLWLARAQKKGGDYGAAIESYSQLKKNVNDTRSIDRELFVLRDVAKWTSDSDRSYSVELMHANTAFSEYSPVLFEENMLVFTSDRDESIGSNKYNWTGNRHSDLYVMIKSGSEAKRFDAAINTEHIEGAACFSNDGLEMVFTRCMTAGENEGICRLYYTNQFTGIWSEPESLDLLPSDVNYGQPTFIENDSVLVFSAQTDDGIGKHDLFYTERIYNEDGSFYWGEAYMMPQSINSIGEEMFPTGDGDTLYFSSDYFAGLGGLDIFKTYLMPNGQWAPPQNLKQPINSSYDDFGLVVDNSNSGSTSTLQKGFFTSTRNGYGKEDIYAFKRKKVAQPVEEEEEEEEKEEIVVDIYLAGQTNEIIYTVDGDPNSGQNGKKDLPETNVSFLTGDIESLFTDAKGQFIVQLEKDKVYKIKGSKIGYLNDIINVDTRNLNIPDGELSYTINVDLDLNKIYSNVEITLDNIYYNFNKYDIRDDAKPTLDSLTLLMQNNPQISIELASHTDCRGDDEYNLILSQKRAESAINYIRRKGVDQKRMSAVGRGASVPAADCDCNSCSEEEHQENRRTTFKIVDVK